MKPYIWQLYSKKLTQKILNPHCQGLLTERFGTQLAIAQNAHVTLYFLVAIADGTVTEAKFTAFGPSPLIGACQVACELALLKNHAQVRRFTADLLDAQMGFPPETYSFLNSVIDLVEQAMDKCSDLPVPAAYIATPMPGDGGDVTEYPGFKELSKEQQIALIEQLIESDIRPYIEMDAGGIRIIDLKGDEIIIAYEGACTSCYSATGATLNAIQQLMVTRIHPDLTVTPDPSTLHF